MKHASLWPGDDHATGQQRPAVVVRPQSAPRFEAWLARMAQWAQSPGKHPEVMLTPIPWRHP